MVTIKKKITRLPDEIIIQSKTPYPNYKQTLHNNYCHECGCYVTLYDECHDEQFCLQCGNVLQSIETSVNNVPYGTYEYGQPYTGTGYTFNEKQYFKSRHKRVPPTFKSVKDRKHIEYHHIIDEFKHELCLDQVDIKDIFIIINKCGGLNRIYRGQPANKILIGIARYLIVRKGIRGYLIRFNNKIYKRYGLRRKDYDKMVRNIELKTEAYRCNH